MRACVAATAHSRLWHFAAEAKAVNLRQLSGGSGRFDYGRLWPATTRMTHSGHRQALLITAVVNSYRRTDDIVHQHRRRIPLSAISTADTPMLCGLLSGMPPAHAVVAPCQGKQDPASKLVRVRI